jgi:hypothetical protein
MPKYFNINEFYEQQEQMHLEMLYLIRETILSADDQLQESMKYNTAFYTRKSWVCYIGKVRKKAGVEVCFPRGAMLSNEHGLLDKKDRAAIMGITFFDMADFLQKEVIFVEILQEALLLDDISLKSSAADILGGKYRGE